MVTFKSPAELRRMRQAGQVVAYTLERVAEAARPGVRLAELDALAAACIRDAGARPSFLDYHPAWAPTPYPAVLCLSVNDVIVHGVPGRRALEDGDLLSVDCGAEVGGYHGDAAITLTIGTVDDTAKRLMTATRQALEAGIAAALDGGRMGDISHAVETVARKGGYGIPDGFGGHGVGTAMHEEPPVPNVGRPHRGMRLCEGLVLAIEPMLCEGGDDGHRTLADGWSVATSDGSRAAHFEHTVAITADGPLVLTAP